MNPQSGLTPAAPTSTTEIARREKAEYYARLEKQRQDVAANPLLILPPSLRHDVWECWECYRGLSNMVTTGALAGLIASWVNKHGVPKADIRAALNAATRPENAAAFKFGSDLTAFLGKFVTDTANRRRNAELARRSDAIRAEELAEFIARRDAATLAAAERAKAPPPLPPAPYHDSAAANARFVAAVRAGINPPTAEVQS